jgi:transposase
MPSASRCASWDGARCSRTASPGRLDELIVALVTARAPGLPALYGIGPDTAALLLIAAGDHPGRLRSEAAWAHLCAAAPIPASPGKVTRHRLNPGGDRQANHALWRIVFTRMGSDAATRAYVERRAREGKSKAEIIRCLKRYVARQVYPHLRPDATAVSRSLRFGRAD